MLQQSFLLSDLDSVRLSVVSCGCVVVTGTNDGARAGEGGVPEGGGEAEGPAAQQGEAGRLPRASAARGRQAFVGCGSSTVRMGGRHSSIL